MFVLVCDHASNRLPRALGSLGLSDGDRARHIAWDIGAAAVTRLMAATLGAAALLQNYSRLVIDCNRAPTAPDSIATHSEATAIPGNVDLPAEARAQRLNEIFHPYHDRLRAELDQRAGRATCLVALHSFTPTFHGESRPMHVGVLYNRDARIARPLLRHLRADGDIAVAENAPYPLDDIDYTLPLHGAQRGLPHVEIEIRQDLIADPGGQKRWGDRLSRALVTSWNDFTKES